MDTSAELTWQPSLFATEEVDFDAGFSRLERIHLDETAWLDYAPGWVSGADLLFEQIVEERNWGQRSRKMYDKTVVEPRLTAPWNLKSGTPLQPEVLERIRVALSERYERTFDSVGFNLYRDGRDSVAWHRDRIPKQVESPIVVLVSIGEPRKFLMRPYGGGKSRSFMLGHGDLLVTGGQSQRTWEHSVPKVKEAGPRISLAYRHDMRWKAYETDDEDES
jgi:alkylated DNA repair dioxygenase AlkB